MTEFAGFLLAAGVSRNKFSHIVEQAYFLSASKEARFHNNRLNQSAVAAMTGLTRNQVRSMLKKRKNGFASRNDRIDRLMTAWSNDAEYVTASYEPRRIRVVGKSPSFSALVRKVGGDVPYRSLLRELLRQNLVSMDGQFVRLTSGAKESQGLRTLEHLSGVLAKVIRSASGLTQGVSPLRAVSLDVNYPAQSGTGRILMQRRLSKSLKAFKADVEAAGAAVAMEAPSLHKKGERKRISHARLMLITHEKDL